MAKICCCRMKLMRQARQAHRSDDDVRSISYEAYISKYRLLYMVVSEPIKSFMGYLHKGNTGWELIHIPFCTLL